MDARKTLVRHMQDALGHCGLMWAWLNKHIPKKEGAALKKKGASIRYKCDKIDPKAFVWLLNEWTRLWTEAYYLDHIQWDSRERWGPTMCLVGQAIAVCIEKRGWEGNKYAKASVEWPKEWGRDGIASTPLGAALKKFFLDKD